MNDAYKNLMARVKDLGRLSTIEQLLDWDQEVFMPAAGVTARAEQTALMAGLIHERLVADEIAALLDAAEFEHDDGVASTNVREVRRNYERAVRVPTDLVKEIAHASTVAKDAWAKARESSDFAAFAPHLSKLLELKKRQAVHIGYQEEAYDALLDEFEPGATASSAETLFSALRGPTVALLEQIKGAPRQPDRSILQRTFAVAQQQTLSREMAHAIGFDAQAGRIDISVHPFCTTIGGSSDVRITTRYIEEFLPSSLFGTLHETGHALYEQGLLPEHRFTPMGEAVSLGIHESQSRMWENMVGRSEPFWEHHYPRLQALFPEPLSGVSRRHFYQAINSVTPSLIRIEADELTYNLHIILRFEIERGLFTGAIQVNDVPEAWNQKCKELLGILPPDDAQGCLQDIHWSMGIFGYFPTYTLGNLYAAQFFESARVALGDLDASLRTGHSADLLDWLRTNIHRHGKRFRASELVEAITGKPLSIEPFLSYVTRKFSSIYGM